MAVRKFVKIFHRENKVISFDKNKSNCYTLINNLKDDNT